MSKRNRSDSPTKSCTADGCDKPLRARGLCATHYNQQHQPNQHVKVERECETCGTIYLTLRPLGRFCSLLCRDVCRREETRKRHALPVLWVKPKRTITQPVVSESLRTWTTGDCQLCGAHFTDRQPRTRFCSSVCSRRWHRKAWKVKANRIVSDAVRAQVYARDAGICQLCMTPVDMALPSSDSWAPTVDHIICQSWMLLPDHRATNLRLAHRWCNSKRSDGRYVAYDISPDDLTTPYPPP